MSGEECCEKSLEPAAYMDSDGHLVFDSEDPVFEWQKPVGIKRVEPMTTGLPALYSEVSRILGEEKTVEPLVRLSDVRERIQERIEHIRENPEDDFGYEEANFRIMELQHLLAEFTQNGDME